MTPWQWLQLPRRIGNIAYVTETNTWHTKKNALPNCQCGAIEGSVGMDDACKSKAR